MKKNVFAEPIILLIVINNLAYFSTTKNMPQTLDQVAKIVRHIKLLNCRLEPDIAISRMSLFFIYISIVKHDIFVIPQKTSMYVQKS